VAAAPQLLIAWLLWAGPLRLTCAAGAQSDASAKERSMSRTCQTEEQRNKETHRKKILPATILFTYALSAVCICTRRCAYVPGIDLSSYLQADGAGMAFGRGSS